MSTIHFMHAPGAHFTSDSRSAERSISPGFNHTHNLAEKSNLIEEQPIIGTKHVETTSKLGNNSLTTWPLDVAVDYITGQNRLAKENAVILYNLAQNAAYHHSGAHPKLSKLVTALFLFLDDLFCHLKKEEQVLIPGIRQLLKTKNGKARTPYSSSKPIQNSTELLMREHVTIKAELNHFRELTSDFTSPEGCCHCHADLFDKLAKFDSELSFHIDLENQVVFPRAISLEEELKRAG